MEEFLGFVLVTALVGGLLSFLPPLHHPAALRPHHHKPHSGSGRR